MDRRLFLGTAGSAGLLAACTTVPKEGRGTLATQCLTRVKVDERRIIRTVAGLRPFRAAGFVVRRDPFGDKVLVHNYGHGGAGITLSWGSSKLATDLALSGERRTVAVLGSGIMGLTTAILAQERGFPVTIYAAQLPPETTSNVAGGQIHPASHYDDDSVDDAWRAQYSAALGYSWRRWQIYAGEDYGVRWLTTYEIGDAEPGPILRPIYAGWTPLSAEESPFNVGPVSRYSTMYVETGRALRRLTADFLRSGGKIVVRQFETPADVAALAETTVINCTGLGAAKLFADAGMIPRRGQLAILLPQPEIDYAYSLGRPYMFPRPDGILLGGTYERDVWDPVTTPEAIAGIIAAHRALNIGCAT